MKSNPTQPGGADAHGTAKDPPWTPELAPVAPDIADALHTLGEWNAHFVLADSRKQPVHHGWQKHPATLEAALSHIQGGGLVGLIPGRSGIAVLDVDAGDPADLIAAHPPLATLQTRRKGGFHLPYAKPEGIVGNSTWAAMGCAGEVRGDKGYVVAWDIPRWAAAVVGVHSGDGKLRHPFPADFLGIRPHHANGTTPGQRGTRTEVSPEMARYDLADIDPADLDPGDYDDWIRCAAALHDAFNGDDMGLRIWQEWSSQAPNYDAEACEAKWATFAPGRGSTYGTIKHLARKARAAKARSVFSADSLKVTRAAPGPNAGPERTARTAPVITKDPRGFLTGLRAVGWDMRFNTLADRREWRTPEGVWRTDSNRIRAKLAQLIRRKCRFQTPGPRGKPQRVPAVFGYRGTFEEMANACFYDLEVDPFAEYLDGLPWDGIPRLDMILHDHFGTPDTELSRWCSRFLFLTAVARTREPGLKIDEHPVLIGPRGCGKTSFVEQALPHEFASNFRQLNLKDDKTAMEGLQGGLVAEIGEGHWLTRQSQTWLKDFLTRRDDGSATRKAFRRDAAPQPRRAAIVITADHDEPLPNDTNLRRFVPARMAHGCHVEALYDEHRDQYWGEAVHRIDNGEKPNLPRRLLPEAHELAQAHRRRSPVVEEAVEAVLATTVGHIKSIDLCREARRSGAADYKDSQILEAARNAGWVLRQARHIAGGKHFRAWIEVR